MFESIVEIFKNKKVLFITTKNVDYIRNTQEIRILSENAQFVDIIFSNKKKYISRVLEIWKKVFVYKVADIDIVFIGFAPQLILPFFYKKFKKQIVVVDFFISIYDTLIHDRKKFKDHGVVAKVSHYLDKKTIFRADHVITDTKADAEYFIREFQGDVDRFKVLYLEADSQIYYPRKQNKRKELENKFVVLYFGSILPLQGVNIVLNAVSMLKEQNDIYFQIIGPIPEKYNKPIQENVEYIDWLSQEELAEYIANADLCLAGHFNLQIGKAYRTIPGKAMIYKAMGKRMILGDSVANREMFEEGSDINFVTIGNADLLAQKIIENRMRYGQNKRGNFSEN